MSGNVAKRYSKALFETCEISELDNMQHWLNSIADIWESSLELRDALLNPGQPQDLKLLVVNDVAKLASSDQRIANLLRLLLENRRLELLPAIKLAFESVVAAFRKALAVEVITASELSDSEKNAVEQKVRAEFGSSASFEWSIDADLIGGMIIKSGDRLLDGSVRGSLERVRSELMRA